MIDITVAITCHSEGILLHKTLMSVDRSINHALEKNPALNFEVLVHADNPTENMRNYLLRVTDSFPDIIIFENAFGGPGKSRDFCLKKASGKYISFIDGDDLMSSNWLYESFCVLEAKEFGSYVAHSEITIEFGTKEAVVQKHGETSKEEDSLLSVWSGRWNAIIFAPTQTLQSIGYPNDALGYGFEDWLLSCKLIYNNIHNILIPDTIMFVRRKESESVWDAHRNDRAVLPANELLSFRYVRSLPAPTSYPKEKDTLKRSLALYAKDKLKSSHILYPRLKKIQARLEKQKTIAANHDLKNSFIQTWKEIHAIEKQLFPTEEILSSTKIYQSITHTHWLVGQCYKRLIDETRHESYDYILFVPWLIKGGADLFAINYANSITTLRPNKKVLVIATLPSPSPWKNKLDPEIDFVNFGEITKGLDREQHLRLLEHLTENSGASVIHLLNSALGYDFVHSHAKYISATKKRVVATSFSESTDETGRLFGYSHTHVPQIYEQASYIASDNQRVLTMWQTEYGFNKSMLHLHHQPVLLKPAAKQHTHHNGLRVLWAARLAPEKLASFVPEIANLVSNSDITIDMFGEPDQGYDTSFLATLPPNMIYKGSFDGFATLPASEYDVFLYTSLFDGMPNALFDATNAGLPIVASAVGGVPEFIEDNTCGLLVEDIMSPEAYAAKIRQLLDAPLRNKLVANARLKIDKEFSESHYLNLIDSMLKDIDF